MAKVQLLCSNRPKVAFFDIFLLFDASDVKINSTMFISAKFWS